MKLYFPDNIFTRMFAENLPEDLNREIIYTPSSAIPLQLKNDPTAAGLITPTDILASPEIFISSKIGISFEGSLSNTYIYFVPDQKDFNSLALFGDISSLEVILSKIFFKENYNSDIEVELLTDVSKSKGKNLLVSGDANFSTEKYNSGLSFAEEMVDMLSLPYVNFVLASMSDIVLEEVNKSCAGISQKIYDAVETGKFGE
jgi:hypothetical protein